MRRPLLLLALLLSGCGSDPSLPPAEAPLVLPEALAVHGPSLLVADPGAAAVWRVDLADHTLVQAQGGPVGPDFVAAGGLAALPGGGFLATGMGRGRTGLVRAPEAPGLEFLTRGLRLPLGVATDGRRAWVADSLAGTVVEVDLAKGSQRIVDSGLQRPTGVARIGDRTYVSDTDAGILYVLRGGDRVALAEGLSLPTHLAPAADGDVLVLESSGLTRVDALTGARTPVATGFGQPAGLASAGRFAWVSDPARGEIVEVHLGTGERTPILQRSAPSEWVPERAAVQGDQALVTGSGLHRVGLDDGSRRPVEAPAAARPFGIAIVGGQPLLTDPGRAALIRPDAVISAAGVRGKGPRFVEPAAVAVLPDGDLAVTDRSRGCLYRVDPETGDRAVLGPSLDEPGDAVARGKTLLVAESGRGVIVEVDLATGRRRDLVKGLQRPGALALDGSGLRIAEGGRRGVLRAAPPSWKAVRLEGRGPTLLEPRGLAALRGGHWLVVDREARALVELRPGGDRRAVQPRLVSPRALAASGEGTVLVADPALGGLLEVDLARGQRRLLEVEELREPGGLVPRPEGGVLVADLLLRSLATFADGKAEKLEVEGLARPVGLTLGHRGLAAVGEGVFGVDLKAGRATRLDRSGVEFAEPRSLAWRGPEVLVADPGLGAVVRVDEEGRRSLVPGALPVRPMGLVANGLRTFALDAATGAILEYGPRNFSVWSRWGERGLGPPLEEPVAGTMAGGRLIVADAAQDALFAVDVVHGHRQAISAGWPVRLDPRPQVSALALGPDGRLWGLDAAGGQSFCLQGRQVRESLHGGGVRPNALAVLGGRLVVGDSGTGTVARFPEGPALLRHVRCEGLAALPDGSLLVADRRSGRLLRLRKGSAKPLGPKFPAVAGLAALPGRAVVLDQRPARITLVDLRSGASRVLEGKGPALIHPSHVAVLPDGALAVSDEGGPSVLRVDPRTGARSVLTGQTRGEGPELDSPGPLCVRQGRLYVGDGSRVLEVEPRTGRRRLAVDLDRR